MQSAIMLKTWPKFGSVSNICPSIKLENYPKSPPPPKKKCSAWVYEKNHNPEEMSNYFSL
jgi:hypothetical protein